MIIKNQIIKKIPIGYKQTEIGVIPEDWDVKSFRDICWVNQGLQIAIKKRLKNPNSKSKIYITIQYLNDGKETEYIDEYSVAVCCGKDDILMTRTGNTGIVISGVDGVFHNNFFKINFDKKQIEKDYLLYYLKDSNTKRIILEKAGTSTIPDLNHNDFYSIQIPLPPSKTEQTSIATALSDTDTLIEHVEKLIAKKKDIKQGAMQQLLTGKKRLPGFSGEWMVLPLEKLCNYQNGTALEKYFNNKSGLLVISIGNYSKAGKFVETYSYIDWKYFKELKKFVLNKNDLTMILNDKTAVGTIIGRVLYIEENEKYIFNQRTMRLTAKDEIEPLFLYFQINSSKTHKYIVNLSKPGTQIYLNTNDIAEIPITFPKSKTEQTAIATILSDMDVEIESLEQKRDKYIMLKQGMMQQLLTGRIRIYANN